MNRKYIFLSLLSLLLCSCEGFSFGSKSNALQTSNSSVTSSKVSSSSSSITSNESSFSFLASSNSNTSSSKEELKSILSGNWNVYGEGENTIEKIDIDDESFKLNIVNVNPSQKYSTQCKSDSFSVTANSTYRLEVSLISSISRTIRVIVQEGNYEYYDVNEEVSLVANEEKTLSLEYVAQDTRDNMFVGFLTGNIGSGYEGEQSLIVKSPRVLVVNEIAPLPDDGPGDTDLGDTPEKEGYNIYWADEFNSNSINSNNWTFEIGTGDWGWGNNEKQYYTDRKENAYVEDGALHIVAKKEDYNGSNYTSARMITKDKVSIHYGYIEARLAIPSMTGIWPAFWMLGSNFDSVGWPKCGEIDIMEAINNEKNKVYSTLHWQYTQNNSQADHGNGGAAVNDRTNYHLYGMNWTSEKIEMYVDNVKTFEMGITGGNGLEAFQKPHFFILNVAVGGNWPGFNIADNFPQEMLVDYIRVYQPK